MSNIFNEKTNNWLFVLKESSHNETIFKQNLFDRRKWQVVTTWSGIKHVSSRVRRGSKDDKQWKRLSTLLNRSLSEASINSSMLKLKSVIRNLRPFLNTELILERLCWDRNPEKAGRAHTIRNTINAWNKILRTFVPSPWFFNWLNKYKCWVTSDKTSSSAMAERPRELGDFKKAKKKRKNRFLSHPFWTSWRGWKIEQ